MPSRESDAMSDLLNLTLTDAARAIRDKRVSSV
jgi:hypothetical protein